MTTINLKDFYYWYTQDQFIEVSEEVAEELRASRRREAAYAERRLRLAIRRFIPWTAMTGSNTLPACMSRRPRSCWIG